MNKKQAQTLLDHPPTGFKPGHPNRLDEWDLRVQSLLLQLENN